MQMLSKLLAAGVLALVSFAASAADIVDTAISAGQFNTLVKAVQEAGLVDTLKGAGPFTVFAPTDAAFAKLPAGTLAALLNDKAKLQKVLTYHVVAGEVKAADVKPGAVKTVEGQSLQVRTKGGAVMEADMPAQVIDPNGRFSLILQDPAADWTTASTIAKTINDAEGSDGEILAVAIDPKNVIVQIPQGERARPDSFISRVRQLPVPLLPTEARVQVNERTGTLIVTGDVEISPVVISHKGLTITTVDPEPRPSPRNPVLRTQTIVPLDTARRGGAKLQDLVNALEQLKVPAEDRITIVKELYKTGMLHAKLIIE